MGRIPFSQVLKNASVDIRREYDRLYTMFCYSRYVNGSGKPFSLKDYCAKNFMNLPFRGTCITLEDFDECHNLKFEENPVHFDLDYLVNFCEYSYNLAIHNSGLECGPSIMNTSFPMQTYIGQLMAVVEIIGYISKAEDGVTIFVPKDQAAISVAEIIDPGLSYKVIEYNHHSMRGDLERKKVILLALAERLESQRNKLQKIHSVVEDDLFFVFNNINIRHNNTDPAGNNYHSHVAAMTIEEIEKWYDDAYQMSLAAFLELDHAERKDRVKQLKEDIQKNR